MTMSFLFVAEIRTRQFIIHFRVRPSTQEVPQTQASNGGYKDPDIEGHYDQHQDIATCHLYKVQHGLQTVLPALYGPPLLDPVSAVGILAETLDDLVENTQQNTPHTGQEQACFGVEIPFFEQDGNVNPQREKLHVMR